MALVFNGSNQIAIANLSTLINSSSALTMAITFKTGAVVTGAIQTICCISRATSYFRGYDIRLSASGVIQVATNGSGGDGVGASPWSTVTATPNTLYRVVLTKAATTTGAIRVYVNTLANTYTFGTNVVFDLTRVSLGGQLGPLNSQYFGGKTGHFAIWPSLLSTEDITKCLDIAFHPDDCSVLPQDYWETINNGTPLIGVNPFTLTNAPTYDIDELSAPLISAINGGNAIQIGQQNISLSLGNFTDVPTVTCTYNNGNSSIPISGVSGTSSAITFNLSDRSEGVNYPAVGTVLTFTCTNGIETAIITRALIAKTGETTIVFSDAVINDDTYLTYDFNDDGFIAENGEFVFEPYGDIDIDVDGSVNVSTNGTLNGWFRPSSGIGDGNVYFYTFILTAINSNQVTIDLSACYVQSESPKIDGTYFYSDRP